MADRRSVIQLQAEFNVVDRRYREIYKQIEKAKEDLKILDSLRRRLKAELYNKMYGGK